jgi:hypothetical protein
MIRKGLVNAFFIVLTIGMTAAAQDHAPIVTMNVTLRDGRTQELTAPESGVARLTDSDGTEYIFRPVIQDSSPWNRIVVTVFKSATANAPTAILGEVELKKGSEAVQLKTNPSFKIAVPKVAPPATPTESTSNRQG